MSLPLSLGAYRDCQQYFERATTDPKGIRLCGGDYDTCFALRQRMHYYRNLDRRANTSTYPTDHPMYGTSVYDDYVLQIIKDEDAKWWLYITARSSQILTVEGLSEVPDLIDVDGHEVLAIEDQTNGTN